MIDVAAIRQRFSAVAPFLDERGRRVIAAAEAAAAGYGGIAAVSVATGIVNSHPNATPFSRPIVTPLR
jgi:hypothetical protein